MTLDDLYKKYFDRLVRMLGRNPDAEDIVQETMIARWKAPKDPANERAYLIVSAKNNEKKRFTRARAPRRGGGMVFELEDHDALDGELSPEMQAIRNEATAKLRARVDKAMAELSPETRACLALKQQGLGPKEIAQHLPLTYQAVRTRLSRATRLLEDLLGEQAE
jgi:RNA polymerase sigma factor (sigma-70 family)